MTAEFFKKTVSFCGFDSNYDGSFHSQTFMQFKKYSNLLNITYSLGDVDVMMLLLCLTFHFFYLFNII